MLRATQTRGTAGTREAFPARWLAPVTSATRQERRFPGSSSSGPSSPRRRKANFTVYFPKTITPSITFARFVSRLIIRVSSRWPRRGFTAVGYSTLHTPEYHIFTVHLVCSKLLLTRRQSQPKLGVAIVVRYSSITEHPRARIHQPDFTTRCSCSVSPAAFWRWSEQPPPTVFSPNPVIHSPRSPRFRRGWRMAAHAVLTQELVMKASAAPRQFVPQPRILI